MSLTKIPGLKDADELDWIELRRELDAARQQDENYPWYKYNWYMPTGLLITAGFYVYGLLNMFNEKKSTIGAYGRVTSQLIVGSVFVWGFLKHARQKHIRHED